jgi:hypothetical protein
MKITTRKQLRELADINGFICAKGRKTASVKMFVDGSLFMCDTPLDYQRAMTVKEAAHFLNYTK